MDLQKLMPYSSMKQTGIIYGNNQVISVDTVAMSEGTITRTYGYRAYVSEPVHRRLNDFLNQLTKLWNDSLGESINVYEASGKCLSYFDQCKCLTARRGVEEWFGRYSARSQRTVLDRLSKAFGSFIRRRKKGEKGGYPKFKSGRRKVRSFDVDASGLKIGEKWNSVSVKGIGKFRFKGQINGVVKVARIVKTARQVKVQLICELPVPEKVVDNRGAVGIDLGVNYLVSLTDGLNSIQIPGRELELGRKKRLQRELARKTKDSSGYRNSRVLLAKESQRLAEQTRGELHELTSWLVQNVSSQFIMEDLPIKNMTEKGKGKKDLNRRILEQNWGMLVNMLLYKCEAAGGYVKKVKPQYTSRTCSKCFTVEKDKPKEYRVFRCSTCGHEEDRDLNASKNILRAGLTGALTGRVGGRGELKYQDVIGHLAGQKDCIGYQCI